VSVDTAGCLWLAGVVVASVMVLSLFYVILTGVIW
jgi:hypothetical protein